ncbi:hypothetical protein A6U86_12215 [Rhizobium sp. AC27/96]|uniref:hypothetical protein n=1 Tax=Rhizobium sp. AC27/96 TaxID=1841653 RepID=UPI00082920F0|nr:hypothetical protein [Rhizobium sp. AC27/96]OCJ00368.1 hypothetical protein A6U86_12215 [Rhizobium sp. AC27/96]
MALRQFVFNLIPSSATTISGVAAARMSRDQLDAIELNFSQQTIDAISERVGMMLPEGQSWASDIRIWGDDKTDDVQIAFEGTAIEQIQFRLDVSNLSLALVGSICALAREFNCVFATRSGGIIRPRSGALIRAITQSEAARFVSDPEGYLREAVELDPEP